MSVGPDDQLTTAEVAALLGIAASSWRVYVSTRDAPPPDGHHDARTPWWHRATIEAWQNERKRK